MVSAQSTTAVPEDLQCGQLAAATAHLKMTSARGQRCCCYSNGSTSLSQGCGFWNKMEANMDESQCGCPIWPDVSGQDLMRRVQE